MRNPHMSPHEAVEARRKRDAHRLCKQPYASELDDRELEHAHREQRPVDPKGRSDTHPERVGER